MQNSYIPANFFWDISVRFLSWEFWNFCRRNDHFRWFPKKSEVFRRRPKSAEGEVIEKTLIHKIRDREKGIVIYSFTHGFRSLHGSDFWKLCQARRQQLTFFSQAWDRSFQPAGVRVGRYTLILKHLHGNRVAAICLKWISVTKVSKYGKSEYSRALNASYTFQPLMSFWYPNKDSNNRKIESARWTMEREGPRALSYFFAPASLQHQETSAEPLTGRETLINFLVIRLCIIAACEAARGWFL